MFKPSSSRYALTSGRASAPQLGLGLLDAFVVVSCVALYHLDIEQVAANDLLHEFSHALSIALGQVFVAARPVVLALVGIARDEVRAITGSRFFKCRAGDAAASSAANAFRVRG